MDVISHLSNTMHFYSYNVPQTWYVSEKVPEASQVSGAHFGYVFSRMTYCDMEYLHGTRGQPLTGLMGLAMKEAEKADL